jgi:hypothetical protein
MNEKTVEIYDLKSKKTSKHIINIFTSKHNENNNTLWILHLNINDNIIKTDEDYLLINALSQLREKLNKMQKIIIVRGSDLNVSMSGMEGSMTAGASITKNEFHNKMSENKITLADFKKFNFSVLDKSRIENIIDKKDYFKSKLGNMKTIWKIEIKIEAYQEISVPKNYIILNAKTIDNKGYIWIEFEVSNENNKDIMKLITVPTGNTFERDGTFIGTLFYNNGKTVQHLYEI